nr:uncharacterized protein LOC109747822 isoform X1 [Aegilops tauschii subsp. strangulata]
MRLLLPGLHDVEVLQMRLLLWRARGSSSCRATSTSSSSADQGRGEENLPRSNVPRRRGQVGWARRGPIWGGDDQAGRGRLPNRHSGGGQAGAAATKRAQRRPNWAPGIGTECLQAGPERLDEGDDASSCRRKTARWRRKTGELL